MVEPVQRAVAWIMNRVRVYHVEEGVRDGAPVFVKRPETACGRQRSGSSAPRLMSGR